MNALQLKNQLSSELRRSAGLERRRGYLGMSGIGNCSRRLYFEFVNGRDEPSDLQYWYCWTGYLHESAILSLFKGQAENKVKTLKFSVSTLNFSVSTLDVVAGFDSRFRGHVDCALGDDLVEIKSVTWDKWVMVRRHDEPVPNHLYQVQMYLRHGGWQRAFLVYIARDVVHREANGIPLYVLEVRPDERLADRLDEKAKAILRAIDAGQPPRCDCGYCND